MFLQKILKHYLLRQEYGGLYTFFAGDRSDLFSTGKHSHNHCRQINISVICAASTHSPIDGATPLLAIEGEDRQLVRNYLRYTLVFACTTTSVFVVKSLQWILRTVWRHRWWKCSSNESELSGRVVTTTRGSDIAVVSDGIKVQCNFVQKVFSSTRVQFFIPSVQQTNKHTDVHTQTL